MAYALVRTPRMSLDGFAARSGLHPDLVRRFVALGLLRADRDAGGRLWLPAGELVTRGPGSAAPGRPGPQLRRDRSGSRSAGAHRRAGSEP